MCGWRWGRMCGKIFRNPPCALSVPHPYQQSQRPLGAAGNRNLPDADILEISFNVQPPDEIRAYTNGRDRIGQVMLKGERLSGLHRRLAEVLSGIYMELEGIFLSIRISI